MWNEQVYPWFAIMLLFMLCGMGTPLGGGAGLGLYIGILQFIGSFGLTQVLCRFGLNHKIRFIGGIVAVMNLEIGTGRLEPLDHLFIVLKDHGKAALRVGIELLLSIETF